MSDDVSAEETGETTDRTGDTTDANESEVPTEPRNKEPRKRGLLVSILREAGIVLALSLVIATLIRLFVVQAFLIPSGSMEDTLRVGDRVAVSKFTTAFGDVERGDVVVFEDPGGWLTGAEAPSSEPGGLGSAVRDALEFVGVLPNDAQGHLIKRVVGVGGDSVTCCDDNGSLRVNGEPIDESGYLFPGNEPSQEEFEVTLDADQVYVMGDHRANSRDSRVNGAVSEEQVVGRAVAVIWPTSHWSTLPGSDAFDDVPNATVDDGG